MFTCRSSSYEVVDFGSNLPVVDEQLREEIELYAQEIAERRQLLTEQKAEFILMQFKFTKAERATRVAEVRIMNTLHICNLC